MTGSGGCRMRSTTSVAMSAMSRNGDAGRADRECGDGHRDRSQGVKVLFRLRGRVTASAKAKTANAERQSGGTAVLGRRQSNDISVCGSSLCSPRVQVRRQFRVPRRPHFGGSGPSGDGGRSCVTYGLDHREIVDRRNREINIERREQSMANPVRRRRGTARPRRVARWRSLEGQRRRRRRRRPVYDRFRSDPVPRADARRRLGWALGAPHAQRPADRLRSVVRCS